MFRHLDRMRFILFIISLVVLMFVFKAPYPFPWRNLYSIFQQHTYDQYVPSESDGWLRPYLSFNSFHPSFWHELYSFDKDGIVMAGCDRESGCYYNPTTIAQYALSCYDEFKTTNDSKYKDIFLKHAAYLARHYVKVSDNMYGYPYPIPFKDYGIKPGWYSGLAQSHAVSILIRAYYLSDRDKRLLPIIANVMNLMLYPLVKGGLLTYTPEGNVWIEEYPSNPPSYVLNGFISSIIGLHEYVSFFTNDAVAEQIYHSCLASLKQSFGFYIKDEWLVYDRVFRRPISPHYMEIQINQMKHLFQLTRDKYFELMAQKLSDYYSKYEQSQDAPPAP